MPFPNIDEFRTALATGGARPTLFQIYCNFPNSILTSQNGNNSGAARKLTFTARAASIPEDNLGQIGIGYAGRVIKVPGDRSYANWTTTIINDEDFLVKDALEAWHNGLQEVQENIRTPEFAIQAGYKQIITVAQYNKLGNIIKSYDLYGAFPLNVSSIGLDWNEQNTIQEFSVTWSYDYWIPSETVRLQDTISFTG